MCDQSSSSDMNQTISKLESLFERCIENIIQNNATNELLRVQIKELTERIETIEINSQIERAYLYQTLESIGGKRIHSNDDYPIEVQNKSKYGSELLQPSTSTSSKVDNRNVSETKPTIDTNTSSSKSEDLIESHVYFLDGTGFKVNIDKNWEFVTSMYLILKEAAKTAKDLNQENKFKEFYAPYKWYTIRTTTGEKIKIVMTDVNDTVKTVIESNKIVDFPLSLHIGCRPTLFVWSLNSKRWGHISLILSDGSYISYWPEEKQMKTWRSLEDDIAAEGGEPTVSKPLDFFTLFKIDENAIKSWWLGFLKLKSYNGVTNNCAHAVVKALIVGDVWISESLKAWIKTPIRSPNSVVEHIQSIIEKSVNKASYRKKTFVPHVAKIGVENVDNLEERIEQYKGMQEDTNDLYKRFANKKE